MMLEVERGGGVCQELLKEGEEELDGGGKMLEWMVTVISVGRQYGSRFVSIEMQITIKGKDRKGKK